MDTEESTLKARKDGIKWWVHTLIALFTAGLTYVGIAVVAHWPPFSSGELAIVSPSDWYQVRSDLPLVAEASGDPGRGQHVWFVAVNPKRKWYPLNEATKARSGRWTASVSPDQISGNVKLCVVAADSRAVQVLEGFFQEAERDRRLYKAGLANPPEGADIKSCVDVLGP